VAGVTASSYTKPDIETEQTWEFVVHALWHSRKIKTLSRKALTGAHRSIGYWDKQSMFKGLLLFTCP